ncbi:MAG: helix-turn-helix transcriptional regulator [Candidatus Omnitrophica bacterium]|nr:helix-turn-helix transcriptional regulator [Candidatus Omnitrophota bacterium]
MLVVVKTPRTNRTIFGIKGRIPQKVRVYLKNEYGNRVTFLKTNKSNIQDMIDPFKSDWYKKLKSGVTKGDSVKIYRKNHNFAQQQLAEIINFHLKTKFTKQKISDIENNRREISKDVAKVLAKIFGTSVERFI